MIKAIILCLLLISCQKYQGPPDYVAMQYAIESYGQQVAKANGLRLLLIDNVTNSPKTMYCMAFTSERTLSLQEAKPLAQAIVDDFLKMLQNSPSVRRYSLMKEEMPKRSLIGLKISFWDSDMNRVKPPNIAEILYVDDTFSYFVRDPDTQELRLECKESDNLLH